MKVFLFPGQGSQEVGMGAEFLETEPRFRDLVRLASELSGSDLGRVCVRGPERELNRSENLQPLLVAICLGYCSKLSAAGIAPDLVAGHSLGEIPALASAGVFSFEDAVRIAAVRGRLMAAAARSQPGGMLAIVGVTREAVEVSLAELLRQMRVFLANDNSPTQVILSGTHAGLDLATARLSELQLTFKRLAVSGPWHTPLMSAAAAEFEAWLSGVTFQAPRVPVAANVSGELEKDPERLRRLVVRNLTEPVQWRSCMTILAGAGAEVMFEVGPGRVVSGLARANGVPDSTRLINVNNQRGLGLAVDWLASRQPAFTSGEKGSN